MDPITLDLVLTVIASSALIGSSAIALCLLPRTDGEVAQLSRAFGWGARRKVRRRAEVAPAAPAAEPVSLAA